MPVNPLEDEYIIEQILAGKKEQFALLVNRYRQLVFQITYRILQDSADAEECAQESFIRAFKYLKSFKGDSSFKTWLYRLSYNHALTAKKEREKKRCLSIEAGENRSNNLAFIPSEYGSTQHEDQKKFLKFALKHLSDEEQSLIQFYYLQELSLREISEITQQSTNFLKVKLHRTREKLKRRLTEMLRNETMSLY